MPLTPFQKGVARVLIANRTPESHIAGGAVINRAETGLRFSDDLDIFHDLAAAQLNNSLPVPLTWSSAYVSQNQSTPAPATSVLAFVALYVTAGSSSG